MVNFIDQFDLRIRHKMANFEGSSCFTSKGYSFFWKVPTTIFVNPAQCPCKLLIMENDITSSKINIFQRNFHRKCILILPIDLYKQKLKIWKISWFFQISWFPKKMTFLDILEQNSRSENIVWYLSDIVLQSSTF